MGGIRPIGSEKLEGMEKIHRIMEIARYKENVPKTINEDKKNEYSISLADGNNYHIVKEKFGYIIKKGINESTADYIDPMKNRKYFSSYSQALKKLNLMAKEFNVLYENEEGTSLFNEEKKKYKLKLKSSPNKKKSLDSKETTSASQVQAPGPMTATEPQVSNTPQPSDAGMSMDAPPMNEPSNEMGSMDSMPVSPPSDDMDSMGPISVDPPSDDMDSMTPPSMEDEDMEDESMGDNEKDNDESMDMEKKPKDKDSKGGSSFKLIQKLTGKLAQKIRTYSEDSEIDSKDVKYILNSILSAIDVDSLDEDDVEDIIARLEGDDEDENFDMDEKDMGSDEDMDEMSMTDDEDMDEMSMKDDEDMEPMRPRKSKFKKEKMPSGEMSEIMGLDDAINKKVGVEYNSQITDELGEDMEYPKHGARFQRKSKFYDDPIDYEMFGESKVDKIISNYFDFSKEKTKKEDYKKNQLKEESEKSIYIRTRNIKRLSENVKQKITALEFIKKYPDSKLLGKTNKGSLVFEDNGFNTKITVNGTII